MPKRLCAIRWTIERAASEFQIDRKTLTKRIRGGDIRPGTDGKFSTAVFGDYRREQLREMRARADKLEIETQTMRKERIPIDVLIQVDDQAHMAIAGIMKSNRDKALSTSVINEIFAQLRDIPVKLTWPGVKPRVHERDLADLSDN